MTTDTLERTDVDLEQLMDHSLRCQSNHRNATTGLPVCECSIEVTHRWSATHPNGVSINVCANQTAYAASVMSGSTRCRECQRPAGECWRLNPI